MEMLMKKSAFFRSVCRLAIPVALQSMLQSSFSVVDQIMIGQLGSVSIAGVGYAGKFASVFSVVVSAVGAVAGIMLSQYLGQKNSREVRRSFFVNLFPAAGAAVLFTLPCLLCPEVIMQLYTDDPAAVQEAAGYLRVLGASFLPMAGATLLSTLFRCMEKPRLPLYASIVSALVNTGLNYLMIFGKGGIPPMGAKGAALATVIAQWVNFLLMLLLLPKSRAPLMEQSGEQGAAESFHWGQYLAMLLPLLTCEVAWSIGENVYTMIYGHMGTEAGAAIVLMNPVQGLVIGALCGLSQAAGVLIGKRLGNQEFEQAYEDSEKLLWYGAAGAVFLSLLVLAGSPFYVQIFKVETSVRNLTRQLLLAYALVAPFKVLNMILGGGIIRSGGRTSYVMLIDLFGTWGIGVPMGLLAAFVWKLTIPYVYFLLSLEECVRFLISMAVFRRKRWMCKL